MQQAILMIDQMVHHFQAALIPEILMGYKTIFALIIIAFVIHWLPSQTKENYRGLFIRTPLVVKIFIFVIAAFIIYQFKTAELQPFIYFKF
jgi:hypothetical protein